jgi:phenylacetate-CoA ligase
MILLFYPAVKAPGLTFTTLQKKHYRGRWKCKRITIRQIKTDTFIIKYVSDIILSQSQIKKKNRRSHRFVSGTKFKIQLYQKDILKETSEAN